MSDIDDHSSHTQVYFSGNDMPPQNNVLESPSQVGSHIVQGSESFDEPQQEGMFTISSFAQDGQARTVLYDINGNTSTAFGPEQQNVDTVLKSSDAVFFYVHRHVLDRSSENGFGAGNMGKPLLIAVDDDALTLNIVLHAVYDRPSDKFSPTVLQLIHAVDRMPIYGILVPQLVQQTTHLFTLLSSMINLNPMDIYALAAHHSLDALAVLASPHLVLFDLSTLAEETMDRIGGQYLKRLSQLQMSRNQKLSDILAKSPLFEHYGCSADPRGAWAFAGFEVLKIMNPGLPPRLLDATMRSLADKIQCTRCKEAFSDAVEDAVKQWKAVKATI